MISLVFPLITIVLIGESSCACYLNRILGPVFHLRIADVQTLLDCDVPISHSINEGEPMAKLTDYVQTAEAAQILGVSQNTLRKWAERGEIPMHRNPANGYRLFKRNDLDKFLKKVSQPVNQNR